MTKKPHGSEIKIKDSWLNLLENKFSEVKILKILEFISAERSVGRVIYPSDADIFSALNITDINDVKVVILGQDPYHGEGQAHGLSFSVPDGIKLPPSLRNIYREIEEEFAQLMPNHGNLTRWAEQGVLLLNATLTVEASKAASHQGRGWEEFTDEIIKLVNENCENVVFMLWGSHAQKKCDFIDEEKHMILKAPHPSPLSAYRGFFGCGHFKQANEYLIKNNKEPIDWVSNNL